MEVKDKRKASVLVCSGCYNKNTVDWLTYKEQKCISHHSGDWEFEDQGTSSFGGWSGLAFWVLVIFSLCPPPPPPPMAEGAGEFYWVSFIKVPIPFLRALCSDLITFQSP